MFTSPSEKNGLKRILPHFAFWAFYVLFFGAIYGKYGNDYAWYLLESLCMLPFVMIGTYVTIYAILPYYLKSRKLLITLFLLVFLLFFVTLSERIFLRKLNDLPITTNDIFGVTFLYLLLETNFMIGIALAIKLVKKWIEQQNEKHEIEKQNLKSELNLLKAQLHPHFLFNAMNNIYALSLEKSSKTSDGIAKMSELLRSVLYDCNEAEISLEKEINLLENYIALEQIRYGKNLDFEFDKSDVTHNFSVPPMLLFTFVENCFKHGRSSSNKTPFIKLKIITSKNELIFIAENSVSESEGKRLPGKRQNGIGLNNVKKRLDIIYGENYNLQILNNNQRFKVELRIKKR